MDSEGGQCIHVAVKIRPLNQLEVRLLNFCHLIPSYQIRIMLHGILIRMLIVCIKLIKKEGVLQILPLHLVSLCYFKYYGIDSVFGDNASDEQVFQTICPPLLKSFLSGINGIQCKQIFITSILNYLRRYIFRYDKKLVWNS